jgi:phosphomannomutase/phosphoglucomutase
VESAAFKSMFREYDIRGRVSEEELNEKSVSLITKAFAAFLAKRNINKVVVGYDNRTCSPSFAEAAIGSFLDSGFDVYDIGLSLSPVLYFAQYHFGCEGAMMITASHNPDGWSGFKLAHGYSMTLGPQEIKELYDILSRREFIGGKRGERRKYNIKDAYVEAVVSRIKMNPDRKPRLVIDAGNGGAGVFAYEIFQRLGCVTFQLNCDPDASYPHYFPNPSDLIARQRLREMVLHPYINADIGIGFDGDGDRIGVIDEKGENVWSDKILIILAKQLLEKKKNAKVVFDVKCTQALPEVIEENGGIPVMWKTGHSHIKSKMKEEKADLAGERSGHIFIGGDDYYGFDDALFVAAKLVEYMSHTDQTLTDILGQFPQYITSPEIKAHCADDKKYGVVEQLVKEFKQEYGDRVIDINGARVVFDDGWGLVRASSNLPELVIIFEAKTEERLKEIRSVFREKILKHDEVSKEWENDI